LKNFLKEIKSQKIKKKSETLTLNLKSNYFLKSFSWRSKFTFDDYSCINSYFSIRRTNKVFQTIHRVNQKFNEFRVVFYRLDYIWYYFYFILHFLFVVHYFILKRLLYFCLRIQIYYLLFLLLLSFFINYTLKYIFIYVLYKNIILFHFNWISKINFSSIIVLQF